MYFQITYKQKAPPNGIGILYLEAENRQKVWDHIRPLIHSGIEDLKISQINKGEWQRVFDLTKDLDRECAFRSGSRRYPTLKDLGFDEEYFKAYLDPSKGGA